MTDPNILIKRLRQHRTAVLENSGLDMAAFLADMQKVTELLSHIERLETALRDMEMESRVRPPTVISTAFTDGEVSDSSVSEALDALTNAAKEQH